MGRKGGSFQFAKRQKELKKQKKRQEKLERKRSKGPSPDEALGDTDLESAEASSTAEPQPASDTTIETKADPDS